MHLKATLLAPVALAAVAGASKNVRDIEPCAQISKLVADANNNQSASRAALMGEFYDSNGRSQR
jgi:hypothetical protein